MEIQIDIPIRADAQQYIYPLFSLSRTSSLLY
ncbi:MAG: hypothetical protein K0S38_229 [Candidatus Paceibacter sp.]|nr:hypothetical protein [Candidatus Paceibacter sp.]